MRAVLGIDAAWTVTQPSGIALVSENAAGWHVKAVAPSYEQFHAHARGQVATNKRPSGSMPNARGLLNSALAFLGDPVDLVAIDMPLARTPITERRVSDNAVSKAYGGRYCGTHSPNAHRPGGTSDKLREDFERAGYPLRTTRFRPSGVIEVYPHPALVELAGASRRLPYKYSKTTKYWPGIARSERLDRLRGQWVEISELLERQIAGVLDALPEPAPDATGAELKAYEDALDAVVCAWVGICALEGKAVPFGDENSAIWIPQPGGYAGATTHHR